MLAQERKEDIIIAPNLSAGNFNAIFMLSDHSAIATQEKLALEGNEWQEEIYRTGWDSGGQGGTPSITTKPASSLGLRAKKAKRKAPAGVCRWELQLGYKDSNLDRRNQNPQSCHWTIPQSRSSNMGLSRVLVKGLGAAISAAQLSLGSRCTASETWR